MSCSGVDCPVKLGVELPLCAIDEYQSPTGCLPCDTSCNICVGGTDSDCINCVGYTELVSPPVGKCVSKVPSLRS